MTAFDMDVPLEELTRRRGRGRRTAPAERKKAAGRKPTSFYHDTTWWLLILTICNLWKNIGYSSVLYLAK